MRIETGLSLGWLCLLVCGGFGMPTWETAQPSSHPLIDAIKSGDADAAARWLATGIDVNDTDEAGIDALGHAAKAGATALGGILLSSGAQVNGMPGGFSAIMRAAFYGHDDFVTLLLKHGADMDLEATNGYAAFDWALEGGHNEVMKTLLAWRIRQDHPSISPVLEAIVNGRTTVLSNQCPSLKHASATAISMLYNTAILTGNLDALTTMLDANLPVNVHNTTGYAPLALACRLDMGQVAGRLLEHGANPNIGNDGHDEASPFLQAARGGNLAMGQLLLKHGANVNKVNARGFSALILAAMYGREPFTAMLLENGAAANARQRDGYSALDYALERNADSVVGKLMVYWAEKHASTPEIKALTAAATKHTLRTAGVLTPKDSLQHRQDQGIHLLNLAVVLENLDLLQALCEHGANPNGIHDGGYGPLAIAAYFGRLDMVETLLDHGAEVDRKSRSRYQTTPLIESTRKGHLAVAKRLLKAGADVNLGDRHGDHALNWAVSYGHLDLVTLFLDHGADVTRTGQEPIAALEIAKRNGFEDIAKRIAAASSNPE